MLNKVMLIGRLGRDPEVRYMPSGDAVANFSVATSETWKSKDGQRQERTEWHNISMFGRLAEVAGQYLKKGSMVYIEGRIQSRKYTGKDGIERTAYEIRADQMTMLGGRNDTGGSSAPYDDGYEPDYEASPAPRAQATRSSTPPSAPRRQDPQLAVAEPVDGIEGDDIPF